MDCTVITKEQCDMDCYRLFGLIEYNNFYSIASSSFQYQLMDKWKTGVLFTSRNIMRIVMYGRTFNPLVQHTKANYLAWLH